MVKENLESFVREIMETMPKIAEMCKPKINKKMMAKILSLDISIHHIAVLQIVAHSSQMLKISEIGKTLSIPFAMMTRIIDKIESQGLVERVSDPNDRRIYRIRMTRKGKELTKRACEMHKKQILAALSRFNEIDRAAFIKAMIILKDILIKYENK